MRKIFAFLFALLAGGFSRVLLAQGQAANHINFTSFDRWHDMVESLAEKGAVVDVWAYGEASEHKPRRIPGPELAELKHQPHEQPTFLTVTYVDQRAGRAVSYQLEFGFQAAEAVLAASRAYQRHRSL